MTDTQTKTTDNKANVGSGVVGAFYENGKRCEDQEAAKKRFMNAATQKPCPHCGSASNLHPVDYAACEQYQFRKSQIFELTEEIARTADELAFWKYQAFWHRGQLTKRDCEEDTIWKELEKEFEAFRQAENIDRKFPNHPVGTVA